MNIFDDQSPISVAAHIAEELKSYLSAHPTIAVTLTVRENRIEIHPEAGETFEILCHGPNEFRMRAIGASRGFQRQVTTTPPAWSDNQRFDKNEMAAKVREWLQRLRKAA
jgi:hypothetical protein